jgi:hypothetical protein
MYNDQTDSDTIEYTIMTAEMTMRSADTIEDPL